jgi:hypothetical protein
MRPLLAFLLVLTLSACATAQKLGAANDVHALLVSIRDDDQATFEAHVDRASLRREIEDRLVGQVAGKSKKYGGLAAVLAPQLAEFAGRTLIQPGVFRYVAAEYGYKPGMQIPGPIFIAQQLKTLPDGRVCATRKKDGPCILMFSKIEGVWKLSGFEGDMKELKL